MQLYNLPFDFITLHKAYKRAWLREHRGMLSEVANNLHVSPQFVRAVYWQERTSKRVERALRRRGAYFGHEPKVKQSQGARNV